MEPKKTNPRLSALRIVMRREDLMTFVSGLHEIQMEMIDEAVNKSDWREAKEVINHIKNLEPR
jgi:hypothetical protein